MSKKYGCPICPEKFDTPQALGGHTAQHSKQGRFEKNTREYMDVLREKGEIRVPLAGASKSLIRSRLSRAANHLGVKVKTSSDDNSVTAWVLGKSDEIPEEMTMGKATLLSETPVDMQSDEDIEVRAPRPTEVPDVPSSPVATTEGLVRLERVHHLIPRRFDDVCDFVDSVVVYRVVAEESDEILVESRHAFRIEEWFRQNARGVHWLMLDDSQ